MFTLGLRFDDIASNRHNIVKNLTLSILDFRSIAYALYFVCCIYIDSGLECRMSSSYKSTYTKRAFNSAIEGTDCHKQYAMQHNYRRQHNTRVSSPHNKCPPTKTRYKSVSTPAGQARAGLYVVYYIQRYI